jgi:uncharacterized protein involved in exopolysaccharide biosynthesis
MGDEFTLEDALIIIRRRAALFAAPAIATLVLGLAIVLLLPAKYTAQGTILVESAQIPSEMVRSTVNTYAQERIQVIRQRVMTRARLLSIADKYDLFPKKLGLSESKRVLRMRERLNVSLITADTRQQSQRDGTIAFTVSYTDRSADKAFKVANEFMSLFLSEDVRTRTAGAENTTEFFKQETTRLSAAVDAMEERISQYKSQNADSLPEHLNAHLEMLQQAKRDLANGFASLSALEEQQRLYETQLASYYSGAGAEGGPASELAKLKSELAQLRSVYKDAHPSVQAVKDQIRSLQAELAPNKEIQGLQSALAEAEAALKTAQRDLPPGDAQIAQKRKAVTDAQQRLSDQIARQAASGSQDFMSATLMGQVSLLSSRRNTLEEQIEGTRKAIADLELQVSKTPEVERGLQALTRNRDNLFTEYQQVLANQQQAQLAENLEDNQKAEKFSILEPAQRPEKPSSPERMKLGVLAIFAAFAVGGLAAIAAEFLFPTVRGKSHLEKLIDGQLIAVIPDFPREGEKRFFLPLRTARRAAAALALTILSAGALATLGAPHAPQIVHPSA